MNKTYKKFILSFIIIFITLLYFLYKYNNKIEQNQVDILVSNRVEIVQNELTNQTLNTNAKKIITRSHGGCPNVPLR